MTNYLDLHLVALAGQSKLVPAPSAEDVARSVAARKALERFLMGYRGALAELLTKVKILKDEFEVVHEYSPIEHVSSRMKSPESIMAKVELRGWNMILRLFAPTSSTLPASASPARSFLTFISWPTC